MFEVPTEMKQTGALAAGIAGAIVSFSYQRPKNLLDAILRVVGGMFGAVYLGPITAKLLGFGPEFESAIEFLIGLVSMHLMGGIFGMAQLFKENPRALIDWFIERMSRK